MKLLLKLCQCFFCWKVQPSPDYLLRNSEVIIALDFGQRLTTPGESNRVMARITRNLHYYYQLPIIPQRQVSCCLADLPKAGVILQHRIDGEYLDTYEVLAQAWEICQKNGWRKAIIVDHPDKIWRTKKTAEKIGFEVAIPDVTSVPYDRESIPSWKKIRVWPFTHPYSRRPIFLPIETAARIIRLLQSKI